MQRLLITAALIASLVGAGAFAYKRWMNSSENAQTLASMKVNSELNINLEIEHDCFLGDLDLILGDLTVTGKMTTPDLLISVEPIVNRGSKFIPVSKRITGADLAAGFRTTLSLGHFESTEHLGVFICRDRLKTGKCNNKAVYNFEQIEQSIRKGGSPRIRKADKVYFFQYLLGQKNGIQFLTEHVESLEQAFQVVNEITSHIVDEKQKEEIRKKSKQLFNALGSYVVVQTPERGTPVLTAKLAKIDHKACQASDTTAVPERVKVQRNKRLPTIFRDMGFDDKKKRR